jgi:hypothetical protein
MENNNNNNNNEFEEFTPLEYMFIQIFSYIFSVIALFGICCVSWIIILTSYKSITIIFEYLFQIKLNF